MTERDITSVQSEMISYDRMDPLPLEKPFYISDKSKYNKFIEAKDSKFPLIRIILYALLIPVFAFIMGVFYVGGIWNPKANFKNLKYVVVNEDAGCVHPLCAIMGLNETTNFGSYYMKLNDAQYEEDGKVYKIGQFDYMPKGSEADAIEKIEKYDYWVALHVPSNFTVAILSNLNAVDGPVQPVVVNKVYNEARSYTTNTFIKKIFAPLESGFFEAIVTQLEVEKKATFKPLFLIQGIQYNENNLYPISGKKEETTEENKANEVTGFGQNFASFVSFVLMWIGTIATAIITHFVFPLENHWVEKKESTHPIMKTIGAKTLTSGILMFIIALIIAIIPLCCGDVVMNKGFAAVLFFLFYFALAGLGVNNLLIHLFHFIIFYLIAVAFMILQLISCGGLVDLDIQSGFFKIGKAFPMYYAVREMKYIYWGTGKHTQTANIMIIFGWAIVFLVSSYFIYYLELKTKRARFLRKHTN